MARLARYQFSRSRKVQMADRYIRAAQAQGVILRHAGSGNGADCTVDGKVVKSFGLCSYLGLDTHPALIQGVHEAVDQFGTQFSISRVYLECPLYQQLDDLLSAITERPVLVTPTTTLGHLACLPVLVGANDAVLVDQFAHASLMTAVELLHDVPVELVRHNRLDELEEKLARLCAGNERVWYICDGVYSMLGDYAPFAGLSALLDKYPQLHLYLDDAHSMSWFGLHGKGAALDHLGSHERVYVALSLNKAFSASGGVVAFPNREQRDRVRRCGGPMIFSGPIQPPMLGAAVASARLHLSAGFADLQRELAVRITRARAATRRLGLRLAASDGTPIFMVLCDSADDSYRIVRKLFDAGFYVCPSTFPAVPINKPSIRFTLSRSNRIEDIDALVQAIATFSLEAGGPQVFDSL